MFRLVSNSRSCLGFVTLVQFVVLLYSLPFWRNAVFAVTVSFGRAIGTACLLLLFALQVVDGLHGVECADGHFHEVGVPVAHGSVPQSGQLVFFPIRLCLYILT